MNKLTIFAIVAIVASVGIVAGLDVAMPAHAQGNATNATSSSTTSMGNMTMPAGNVTSGAANVTASK